LSRIQDRLWWEGDQRDRGQLRAGVADTIRLLDGPPEAFEIVTVALVCLGTLAPEQAQGRFYKSILGGVKL